LKKNEQTTPNHSGKKEKKNHFGKFFKTRGDVVKKAKDNTNEAGIERKTLRKIKKVKKTLLFVVTVVKIGAGR